MLPNLECFAPLDLGLNDQKQFIIKGAQLPDRVMKLCDLAVQVESTIRKIAIERYRISRFVGGVLENRRP